MKLALPKMTPKQKFILFAVTTFIVISVVMTIKAFSSKDSIESKGSVKVDKSVTSDAQTVTGSKATSDNEANRKLRELQEEERQKRLSDDSELSYLDKPVLTPNIGEISLDDESVQKNNNKIIDIEDLINEIAEENKEKKKEEVKQRNIIDSLTEKKKTIDKVKAINFDRNAYLNSLNSINSDLPTYDSTKLSTDSPFVAVVNTYPSVGKGAEAENGEILERDVGFSEDDIVRETLNKRDEQLNRFLESSGLNANKSRNADTARQVNSSLSNDNGNEEYPYKEIKSVGDTVYAINRLPINTDGVPIVQLTIVSPGDMNNAVLSGNFTKMQDSVVLRFSSYSKNGNTYPINAIAIDPDTMESMMADDVDKHYWQRYGGVILASIIQGYSQSLQNVTISDTNSGQRETQQRVERFNDRLMVGFGKAGATLAPHFLRNANRESTVYLYKDRPVAVLFLDNFKVPISN